MKQIKKNKITKIFGHDVLWWVDSNSVNELDEYSIEHIEDSIKDEYSQGELNVPYGKNMQKETSGWWHIIDWKSIALELYTITKVLHEGGNSDNKTVNNALKAFDDNWN